MIEGGLYHVYNRFARGEEIFGDPEEAICFVDRLHEVKARDGFAVLAWCLMSSHFHLALRISFVPLSRTMHYLCLEVNPRDLASRRQDSTTGRVRRLVAACGIERWNQRAVDIAKVMRKHPVVVSRWVSEAGRIRNEDNGFAKDLDAMDQAMSDLAIERLAEIRAAERES